MLAPHVATIVGLQNDLVGLRKDVEEGEKMNHAILLTERKGLGLRQAVEVAVEKHNQCVRDMLEEVERLERRIDAKGGWRELRECMVGFVGTHFEWATAAKRYKTTT
jgi:hypothetical protein